MGWHPRALGTWASCRVPGNWHRHCHWSQSRESECWDSEGAPARGVCGPSWAGRADRGSSGVPGYC